MRTCVIFNPTAKGDKARRFRRNLDRIGAECTLKQTTHAGAARTLAAEAVQEGFNIIVAAGGDGTVNEVLNGIGDAPDGFKRACLGVFPLGTVNVFAKELGLPTEISQAWEIIKAGQETTIDLPAVKFAGAGGASESRYFAQLAGAGLDARAIELVDWQLKKKLGPLAYVWAGMMALRGKPAQITVTNGTSSATGALVLVGNGRFYGGRYRVFPEADLQDGQLEVVVFPRANWLTLARCSGMFLAGQALPASVAKSFKAHTLTLTSTSPTPLEVDGDNIGHLPAVMSIQRQALRVVVPGKG
ncbi:diacylglycerol/lipid kinase family protein [Pedosphaera parvula]|uniref:Diacylglycerol kinase catalytic region n=1 Tax=Pedosphaera parvula (strain Ellin514) TaxID=320771 RepID=B9XF95_PEDPL|nr:diacylglycerol kinase family protein [Pedosphaera parvula]EEF61593.1 diacylglycerol kinase catalytic region [Pedosphaera parvula Ellin514]